MADTERVKVRVVIDMEVDVAGWALDYGLDATPQAVGEDAARYMAEALPQIARDHGPGLVLAATGKGTVRA